MSSVRQASRSPAKVEGFVVANLDGDVLAGTPFMEANDITVPLTATGAPHPAAVSSEARRAILLRSPPTSTTWPGEFVEVKLPANAPPDSAYALEPCTDAPNVKRLTASQLWPSPGIVSSVAGKIRIPNLSPEPHFLKRNEHFCQVRPVSTPEPDSNNKQLLAKPPPQPSTAQTGVKHSSTVRLDPDNLLPGEIKAKFTSLDPRRMRPRL